MPKTLNDFEELILVGGGAHAWALKHLLASGPHPAIKGYTDLKAGVLDLPYLGDDRAVASLFEGKKDKIGLVMAIGIDIILRTKLFKFWKSQGYGFVNIVHPSSVVAPEVKLGEGIVIFPLVVIGAGVKLGDNVCVYSNAVIEHRTEVGSHSYISPSAAIAGDCHLGEGCLVGINVSLIEQIHLADKTTVGAGAVVINNFDVPGTTIIGVPARAIKEPV